MLSAMVTQSPDTALSQVVDLIYAEAQAQGLSFDADERKILTETSSSPLSEQWIEKFEEEQDREDFSQKVTSCLKSAEEQAKQRDGRKGRKAFRDLLELASKSGTYVGGTIACDVLETSSISTSWSAIVIGTVVGSVLFIGALYAWLVFSPTPAGQHIQEVVLRITQRVTIPLAIAGAVTFGVWWWRQRR
jgi:hypothetical protein